MAVAEGEGVDSSVEGGTEAKVCWQELKPLGPLPLAAKRGWGRQGLTWEGSVFLGSTP